MQLLEQSELRGLEMRIIKPSISDLNIARGQLVMLVGSGGDGKTYLAMDLLMRAAKGMPVFKDGLATEPQKTAYIDYEVGRDIFSMRLRRLHYSNCPEITDYDLHYVDCTEDDKLDVSKLRELITSARLELIAVDNLRCALPAETDMNTQSAATLVRQLRALAKETGCTILLLHHRAKGNASGLESGSGTQAFTDAVEQKLVVQKTGDSISIKSGKANDFASPSFWAQMLDDGEPVPAYMGKTEGIQIAYSRTPGGSYESRVIQALESGPLTRTEIKKRASGNTESLVKAIDSLVASKKIRLEGKKLCIA